MCVRTFLRVWEYEHLCEIIVCCDMNPSSRNTHKQDAVTKTYTTIKALARKRRREKNSTTIIMAYHENKKLQPPPTTTDCYQFKWALHTTTAIPITRVSICVVVDCQPSCHLPSTLAGTTHSPPHTSENSKSGLVGNSALNWFSIPQK